MSFRLQIVGLNETINRLKKEGIDIRREIGLEVEGAAVSISKTASQLAPKNFGDLGRSISSQKVNDLNAEVVAQSQYAAYMEFGTKRKVNIPPGFESYAGQFRGKRPSNVGLFKAIREWARNKGIDQKAAGAIAYEIMINGVKPQPFMFPALMRGKSKFLEDIKAVLKRRR